jgi:catechol 2,3-dioxygenase-like lactoylglutathione lyase family enzyme
MLDHVGYPVTDLERSRVFYTAALAPLGIKVLMEITREMTGDHAHVGFGVDHPDFWIGEGKTAASSTHVAFKSPDRRAVDAFYAAALAAGGRDNGKPGVRPHYHEHYYAAFVFDPDSNNVEAVCHAPA